MSEQCRLRLRLPNGAELEVSGAVDYVCAQRDAFLGSQGIAAARNPALAAAARPEEPARHAAPAATAPGRDAWAPNAVRSPMWDSIIETAKGANIQLRAKLPEGKTDKEACLVLLAAAQKILNFAKPTASQLARWLRASGYPVQRVDRAISAAVQKGEILASGSRRARRYELTGPGRAKGFLLAQQLSDIVTAE